MNLDTPISYIKGVGPKLAEKLNKAGVLNIRDFIYLIPRSHHDYSSHETIKNIRPGNVIIKAKVEDVITRRSQRGITITTATLFDKTEKISATWFNQPYRESQFNSDQEYYFIGEYNFSFNKYQLLNPKVEQASETKKYTNQFVSSYSQLQYIRTNTIRKIFLELKPFMSNLKETIPDSIVERAGLMSFSEAIENIHFPTSQNNLSKAKARLAFDEIFQLLLASQLNKKENSKLRGYKIKFNQKLIKSFVDSLPYRLTNAQRLSIWDILQDLEKVTPMNRMVQGDVGSGKTIVAGISMLQVVNAGYQCVLLAPTEILASQHAETLSQLLKSQNISVGLLTAKVKGKNREALYKAIESGGVDIIVGTHAVIQEKVLYKDIGLIVIDEQHRFGVNQRQMLLSKSKTMPHVLTMTATPIPRSLALTLYGELDISILHEKPVGRLEILTKLWSENKRDSLIKIIDEEIDLGRQAYIICSLIDDNPDNDLKSVQTEYQRLKQTVFKHRNIGLLHGKLTSQEKNSVMDDFKRGKFDILVSTTVVEVGVDVPNATIIIIEDSERFGLSQLHQLRGRVGRSDHQSYCYLMYDGNKKPSNRLQEIEKSNDGFYLAEVDLKLRGPGEIYGRMQHGALNLQIASLADTKLIAKCLKEAKYFVEKDYELVKYKELSKKVNYYQKLTTLN